MHSHFRLRQLALASGLALLLLPGTASALFTFNAGIHTVSDDRFEYAMLKVTTPLYFGFSGPQTQVTLHSTAVIGPENVLQAGSPCATDSFNNPHTPGVPCLEDTDFTGQGLSIDQGGSGAGVGGMLFASGPLAFQFAQGSGSKVIIDGALVKVQNDTGSAAVVMGGGSLLTVNSGTIGSALPSETGDIDLFDQSRLVINGGTIWGDITANQFATVQVNGGVVAGDTDIGTTDKTKIQGSAQLVMNGGMLNDVALLVQATMIMTGGTIDDDLELLGSSRADIFGGTILGNETGFLSEPTLDVLGSSILVLYGDNFVLNGVPVTFTAGACAEGAQCRSYTFLSSPLHNGLIETPTIDVDGNLIPDFHALSGHLQNEGLPFGTTTLRVGSPSALTATLRLVQAPITVIPEPGTALLLGFGLAGIAVARRRRR